MGTDFPWNATEEEQGQTKATVVLVFISFFYSWRIRDLYATSTDLVSASVSHLPVSGNRRPGCMPSRASVERTWTAQWGIEIDGCFRACFCNLFFKHLPSPAYDSFILGIHWQARGLLGMESCVLESCTCGGSCSLEDGIIIHFVATTIN